MSYRSSLKPLPLYDRALGRVILALLLHGANRAKKRDDAHHYWHIATAVKAGNTTNCFQTSPVHWDCALERQSIT